MKVIKFIFAILLIPFCYTFLRALFDQTVLLTQGEQAYKLLYLLYGIIVYFFVQILFAKPIRTYILGHEITHILAALLYGSKVKSLRITKKGGSVVLSKANTVITLAPYFVPIYTVICFLIYWFIHEIIRYKINARYLIFFVGLTMAFHLSLTYYAIRQGQSDLKREGTLYSIVVVLLFNVIVIWLIFVLLFKIPIKIFFELLWQHTMAIFAFVSKILYNYSSSVK